MMRRVYEIGDEVEYPSKIIPKEERRLTVIDFKLYKYSTGKTYVRYLYDGLIQALVAEMKSNIEQDFDNIVLICGDVGNGKSNLAYYLAKHYDPNYRVKNTVYEFEQLLTLLDGIEYGSTIIIDEAEHMINKKDFNKIENRTFERLLTLGRSMHLCIIMCFPFESNVMPFVLSRTRYILDAQILDWEKRDSLEKGYYRLKRVKTFENKPPVFIPIGYGTFSKMERDASEIYERGKADSLSQFLSNRRLEYQRIEERRTGETKNKPGRPDSGIIWELLEMADNGMSAKQIADARGLAIGTVYNALSKARRIKKAAEDN